ncbi:TPA: RNA-binding protein [Candidatus Micrarchaeota archaeon]|nr:RNA-binding protein [Candidatus Micrarchaeota archaeon]
MDKTCSTCGRQVLSVTAFACPGCGKTTISRCNACKQGKNAYVCGECGFQGP